MDVGNLIELAIAMCAGWALADLTWPAIRRWFTK